MKRVGIMLLSWLVLGTGPAFAGPAPVSDWVETGRVQFSGPDRFFRSQGVASDGRSLFFSWNLGLSRTEIDDTSVVLTDNTTEAIPDDLIATNHNHIGDIDVADGILYAPIEDGPAYAAPWVVLYDARTLQPTGRKYLLPAHIQRDGVPWVAVDKPRGVAYSMEWNDNGKLFVYRLKDFQLIRTVDLSQPVPRIQGAKLFRGQLYASRDNGAEHSVVAIDPGSGRVTHLFDRNLGHDYEAEGIAFVLRPSGSMMVATGIREGAQGYTEMRIYRIGGDETPPRVVKATFKQKRIRPGRKLTLRTRLSEPVTAALRWFRCIGSKGQPCRKTRAVGITSHVELPRGAGRITLPSTYQRAGNKKAVRLKRGRWQLQVTPTDRADIVGRSSKAGLAVLKPRPKRR